MEVSINQEEFKMETESMALEGKHNMKKCNGSNLCTKLMQIRKATIRESLSNSKVSNIVLKKY
jgi:UDP-N-acetylmuramoylalanine--D-glutamate ligase